MREIIKKLLSIPISRVLGHYGYRVGGKRDKSQILCPFHSETHPSFLVNHDKNFCYCFGCAKSWDSIQLIREFDNCTFLAALQKLCKIGGFKELVAADVQKIYSGFKSARTETFADQEAHAFRKFIDMIDKEFSDYYKSFPIWKSFKHIVDYLYMEFDHLKLQKPSRRIFDQCKDWFHKSKREIKSANSQWKKLPLLKREAYFDRVNFKNF
jgi:hypothetical protein